MRNVTKRVGAALAVGGAVAALIACNVFVSIDQCGSDADCPAGATCDPAGRYCHLPGAEAAPPDAAREAVADAAIDAADSAEAAPPRCDPLAPFTSFTLVKGFEGTPIISARLTPDETTILYSALNGCAAESCYDLFVAHRGGLASAFGADDGGALPVVNCNMAPEYWPTLSADAKLLFFESARALKPDGGACGFDVSRIWAATRASKLTDFDPPRVDALFADPAFTNSSPYLHPNGRSLYFVSIGRPGPGGQDIYVATLDPSGFLIQVAEIPAVNTPGTENFPTITLDETTLFYARDQPAGPERDIWVSHRASATAAFGKPQPVKEVNSPADEIPAWVSDDQCRLYFTSNRNPADAGTLADYRLWIAERQRQ